MTSGNVLRPEDFPLRTTDGGEIRGLSTLEELEKELIAKTLIECNWNKSRAAKRIGIGRRTLYEKAMRLGIPLKPDGE